MCIPVVTSSWLIILKESSSFLSLISPWESKRQNVSLRIIVAREQKEISICCSLVCFPHFICRGASVDGGAISFITEDASVSLEGILFTLHYLSCFYEWVGSPWYIHGVYLGLTELYISFTCLSLVTGGCIIQSQLHTSNGTEQANLILTCCLPARRAGWLPSVWLWWGCIQ